MVKLPGKFGQGSSTLAKWIGDNLKKDAEKNKPKPKPKPRPKPPIVEIKEKLESYKESQASLQSGLLAKLKELGEKPSREEVKKTVEQFRKDNADLIESQKELGKSINEWQKENRPERTKRPEPPEAIKEQAQKVRQTKKALDEVKGAFHEALKRSKDLSKEERAQLVKEFKEANADNHKALKEAQKELQKQIREIKQEGERRQ
jgi:Ca2+-binding EF-hand superfamily protein